MEFTLSKKLYVFVDNDALGIFPTIIPVSEIESPAEGLGAPWRQCKKRLREYYLGKAKALREVSEQEFFKR